MSAESPFVADLFDEVEEQLRSDRYKTLALKAAPWVLGLALILIVASFGVFGWRQDEKSAAEKASDEYGQALEAMQAGRGDEAFRLFGDVAKSNAKGYKALALMQQG